MTDPRPQAIVLLVVKNTMTGYTPLPGSTVVTAACGHQTYISPTSIALLDTNQTIATICSTCVSSTHLVDPDAEKYFVPGARKEMEEMVGVARADQVFANARDHGIKDMP